MGKLSEFDDRFATIPPFHDCLLLAAAICLVPFEHNGRMLRKNQYLCIFTQKEDEDRLLLSSRSADMKKTFGETRNSWGLFEEEDLSNVCFEIPDKSLDVP